MNEAAVNVLGLKPFPIPLGRFHVIFYPEDLLTPFNATKCFVKGFTRLFPFQKLDRHMARVFLSNRKFFRRYHI